MSRYLIEVGYTPTAWAAQIEAQGNVVDRITPAVRAAGGTIDCLYYAFGDNDLVGVIDFPTPEDAAAFALTVTASGALRSYRTTPLMTVDQGIDAMHRATALRDVYAPPSSISLVQQGQPVG
jgi:uncharacterized protein with GYD domain